MNPLAVTLVVAVLAAIAAAGVGVGFVRRNPLALEPPPDPLEDRRVELLRSVRDLEEAHAGGALADARYAALRRESEDRIARVLRAIDAREARVDAGPAAPTPAARRGGVPPWAVGVLVGATVVAVVVVGLLRTATPVPSATGPASSSSDPLTFFEQRVRQHPNDLAARLDLALRYLDAGRARDALAQYAVVLQLDPADAEARAYIGLILYSAGRPKEALASVNRALETDPAYPEALFIKGLVLLKGLDRPAQAEEALHAYLDAAPFGDQREAANRLIARADMELSSG